jgi:hypothetical protein
MRRISPSATKKSKTCTVIDDTSETISAWSFDWTGCKTIKYRFSPKTGQIPAYFYVLTKFLRISFGKAACGRLTSYSVGRLARVSPRQDTLIGGLVFPLLLLRRIIAMTFKTLLAATCLSLAAATAGSAAVVTVDGEDWEISILSGSFDDLGGISVFEAQPWWQNFTIASDFASATGLSAGEDPFFPGFGPNFAYDADSTGVDVVYVNTSGDVAGSTFDADFSTTAYAFASPVPIPVPAGGLLLLTGLGGIVAFNRRKKRAA